MTLPPFSASASSRPKLLMTVATIVDVHTVRLVMRDRNLGAQLAQNARRRFVSGAVRHIDRDSQPFKRHVARETAFCEFHITAKRVVDSRRATNFSRGRPDVVDLTAEN